MHALKKIAADINGWLFACLFFLIPIQIAPAYVISAIILLLWLFEGGLKEKWLELKSNPVFWLFQAYFWFFVLSLLWTENLDEGLRMVRRNILFLLSPVFMTIAQRLNPGRCMAFFLSSVGMCVVLAYYNWLRLHFLHGFPPGLMVSKSTGDTAPFVDRIMYSPILAFAGYLVAEMAIQARGRLLKMSACMLFFAAIAGNLIFSDGRAGQVSFVGLMILLTCRHLKRSPMKAMAAALLITAAFAALAYMGNASFRYRADLALYELMHYREMAGQSRINHSSTGLRLTFWSNSLQIFLENPIAGVGAGDFSSSYAEVNRKNTPAVVATINPHNQYLFVMTTTGIFGGVLLLAMYLPPGLWRSDASEWGHAKSGLSVLFILISLFESYVWRSNTCLMFVLLSSMLYCRSDAVAPSYLRATAPVLERTS